MLVFFPRRMRGLGSILLLLCACAGIDSLAGAATITWGTPQTISGDSDVSTVGTLVYAYNFGPFFGPATVVSSTVNGITFEAFPITHPTSVTVGSVTISESPANLIGFNVLSVTGSYGALSPAYRAVLNGGAGAGFPDTVTLSLGGLSAGQQYLFQWWASNAANIPPVTTVTGSATSLVTLDSNFTDTDGGLGQFVTGTFTADGTTQSIAFTGAGQSPLINAFQIRAVPEPSTYVMALAGLACGGCAMRRRKRS